MKKHLGTPGPATANQAALLCRLLPQYVRRRLIAPRLADRLIRRRATLTRIRQVRAAATTVTVLNSPERKPLTPPRPTPLPTKSQLPTS